jgi:hypothetical protein
VDGDSIQNRGLLPIGSEHPSLGSGDEVGDPQLLGVSFFGSPKGFSESGLAAFHDGDTGLCFGIVDMESPGIYFGFHGAGDAVPQLGGLLIVLLVEGEQVLGHQL